MRQAAAPYVWLRLLSWWCDALLRGQRITRVARRTGGARLVHHAKSGFIARSRGHRVGASGSRDPTAHPLKCVAAPGG